MTDTMALEWSGEATETEPATLPEAAENRARAWLSRRLAWEDRLRELQRAG